jgi:hypothetical protein
MTARPSGVMVDDGGPLLSKVQTGCFWPLRVVPGWTLPSWAPRTRTSRGVK